MAFERDWVRVVAGGPCPDCGSDTTALPPEVLAGAFADQARRWGIWLGLAAGDGERLRCRPKPSIWSALEYAAHVRDVLSVLGGRVERMLTEEAPQLGWWDHEVAVVAERYNEQDPMAVASALEANAKRFASVLDGVGDPQWERPGTRGDGERFTVSGLARYALHESAHHLADADRALTRATPPAVGHGQVGRVVLSGALVRLEPLSRAHVPDLVAASSGDRSTFGYSGVPDGWDATVEFVERALAAEEAADELPFATVAAATGEVVGSTRFTRMEWWSWPPGHPLQRHGVPDAVEIGYTWLNSSTQRTGINREAKLLMLIHAFEVWKVHRVAWRTDVRNERSRRAIEALGAAYEGIRRAERPAIDGSIRDSAFYSMMVGEWPAARRRLEVSLRR